MPPRAAAPAAIPPRPLAPPALSAAGQVAVEAPEAAGLLVAAEAAVEPQAFGGLAVGPPRPRQYPQ
eukprot:3391392-Lingulodinium_polyedra.AAC.1